MVRFSETMYSQLYSEYDTVITSDVNRIMMKDLDRVATFIPPLEKYMGIYCYLILTQPAFGRIKIEHDDFIVDEVIENIEKKSSGLYLVLRIEKRNWDTIKLSRIIASRLNIPRSNILYLGIKDKIAVASQYFFIKNGKIEFLDIIKEIPDIKVKEFFFTDQYSPNILVGNKFEVNIYDVKNLKNFIDAFNLVNKNGFLNYYGIQRFGITRPITHVIGRLLLSEDYEGAFFYLTSLSGNELEKTKKYRNLILNGEYETFVKEAPPWLYYEKILVMNYLRYKNYKKAFKKLPFNYKRLFFHAYQSYVFNRALSYYYIYDKLPSCIKVTKEDPFVKEILLDDGLKNFRASRKLGVRLRPIKRKTIEIPKEFKYKILSSNKVKLNFYLNKGVYATSLIREICKNKYW